MDLRIAGSAGMNKAKEIAAIKVIEGIFSATKVNNVSRTMSLLGELEGKFNKTINYFVNGPGCYIEAGDITNDVKLVQRGIHLANLSKSNSEISHKSYGLIEYNLGNGFYCLYKIARRTGTPIDYYNCPDLQNAKLAYSGALNSQEIPHGIRIQAVVNLANVFDTLGRTVEAIKLYEKALQLDRSFAMAKANLGKALHFFAAICGKYRTATLIQAYQLIDEALQDSKQLLYIGGHNAVSVFQRERDRISAYFQNKSQLKHKLKHSTLSLKRLSNYEKDYIQFCFSNKLFLNFHVHMSEVLCRAAVSDDLSISLVENVKAESHFFYYCKYINQMKEDYATARFLLFQSTYRKPFLNRISKITHYVDTLDYSSNNLYMGMLKAAFNRAYSILDKIAVFLDAYLNLGTRGKIYFSSIWAVQKGRDWTARDEIRELNNPCLLGLYDVNHDFRSSLYHDIPKIRNAAEHDRLSVVSFGPLKEENSKNNELVMTEDTLQERTIELMQIVKSCISNLVNFVNIEENKKIPQEGITMPITYFDQEQVF